MSPSQQLLWEERCARKLVVLVDSSGILLDATLSRMKDILVKVTMMTKHSMLKLNSLKNDISSSCMSHIAHCM